MNLGEDTGVAAAIKAFFFWGAVFVLGSATLALIATALS